MFFDRNDQYHNYNTRQSRSLHPSVGRGEAIYRSFSFHGVNIWNYLSTHIPTNLSYNRFNKLNKSYLPNNNIIIYTDLYRTIIANYIQYVCVLFYNECCSHILEILKIKKIFVYYYKLFLFLFLKIWCQSLLLLIYIVYYYKIMCFLLNVMPLHLFVTLYC